MNEGSAQTRYESTEADRSLVKIAGRRLSRERECFSETLSRNSRAIQRSLYILGRVDAPVSKSTFESTHVKSLEHSLIAKLKI